MRRTLTVCRNGMAVAAAVVLLTACGGSGDEDSSPAAAGDTSSSASETTDSADSEFCMEAASIQERVGATLNDQSNPATLPQTLQQAAEEIRAVEAPEEISADWTSLADGVDQIAEAFSSIDFTDPKALATFEQQVGALQGDLESASANVGNYLRDECGIEPDATEPASPSS